jgi:tetratricopeptide (TPR) repeat protein
MYCNFPVAIWFYVAAVPLLLISLFPRSLEAATQSRVFWVVGSLLYVAAWFLLPSRNHLLGDGMQRLADAGKTFMPTEALDILLHRLVYLVIGSSLWSYRVIGLVTGLFYLNGIRLLARLGESVIEKAIITLSFLCLATVQYYFGYVESYGLVNLFILYYVYFAWKCLREERLTAAPLIFFCLTTASHISGAALFPSLAFLYYRRFPKTTLIVVPIAILAAAAIFYLGSFWHALVTLFPTDYSAYSLFSLAHGRDLLCELLLVTPAFFLVFLTKRWDRIMAFTAVALAGTLVFAVAVDPVLGAVRDWDLLSIFAVPLAALIALRAPRKRVTVAVLIALIVIRTLPWLVFNSQLQTSSVKKILADDIHYSGGFAEGERLDSWGLLLYKVGDPQGAVEAWKKRLQVNPDRPNTLAMLAPLQFKLGQFPESYRSYLRLLQYQPDNPEVLYHAAYTLFRMGDWTDAIQMISNTSPEFANNPNTRRLMAGLLGISGQHREAVDIIEKTPGTDQEGYLPYVLAGSCLAVGKIDLARQLIGRALELDSTNVDYRHLAEQIGQR